MRILDKARLRLRSLWSRPKVEDELEAELHFHLDQLTAENMGKDVFLARPQPLYNLGRMSGAPWDGDAVYLSPNTQPGTTIYYWLKTKAAGDVKLSVQDASGTQIAELTATGNEGLNALRWNGRARGRTADPGDYRVVLTVGGKDYTTSVKVDKADGM